MDELRYNRLMPFFLVLAVISGAVVVTIANNALRPEDTFLVRAVYFVFTILSQLAIFSLFWYIAARWPRIGGLAAVLFYIGFAYFMISASFRGDMPDTLLFRAMALVHAALWVTVGIMMAFSQKAEKVSTTFSG